MFLNGKILTGSTKTFTTKKGDQLPKTRLKVLDVGNEASNDVMVYWIDFIGDAALSDTELTQIQHQEVVIEVRRVMTSSGKDGKAYLNLAGGAVLVHDRPVQTALRSSSQQSA